MTLEDWLLARFGAEKFAPGLERVRSFVSDYLDQISEQKPLIVTVAGTNGKGQTALSLARHFKFNGKKISLWTSPHITSVCERFVDSQGQILENDLRELVEFEARRAKEFGVGLSYYEILWCAFLRWNVLSPKEVIILEVGMGGRLDAVNLLDAQIVALTSISRDHQEFLGNRFELILLEKLGVMRPGAQLFSGVQSRYLKDRIEKHSKALGYFFHDVASTFPSQSDFWNQNELLSRAMIESLGLQCAPEAHSYEARSESVTFKGNEFVFFGSHNPDGARKLIQLLQHKTYNFTQDKFDFVWVAMSQRSEKDLGAMAKIFSQLQDCGMPVCFTLFSHPKAAKATEWWKSTKAQYVDEWTDLFSKISDRRGQKILVTGSYYFISQLKSHFSQSR